MIWKRKRAWSAKLHAWVLWHAGYIYSRRFRILTHPVGLSTQRLTELGASEVFLVWIIIGTRISRYINSGSTLLWSPYTVPVLLILHRSSIPSFSERWSKTVPEYKTIAICYSRKWRRNWSLRLNYVTLKSIMNMSSLAWILDTRTESETLHDADILRSMVPLLYKNSNTADNLDRDVCDLDRTIFILEDRFDDERIHRVVNGCNNKITRFIEATKNMTKGIDILDWRRSNGTPNPTLCKHARDVLATQATLIAIESVFSLSNNLIYLTRRHYQTILLEFACWYKAWSECLVNCLSLLLS